MPTTAQSVGVGLATMGLVAVTYNQFCPRLTDLSVAGAHNRDAARSEKAARYTSAALVIGITVVTRDAKVAIMGAVAVIAYSWQHRYAIAYDPAQARVATPTSPVPIHAADGMPAGYTPAA